VAKSDVGNPYGPVDDLPLVSTADAYELRRCEDILSTGRLTADRELGPVTS
jgi:hypothetical protein